MSLLSGLIRRLCWRTSDEGGDVPHPIWDRIEEARARWNVLEHPFYERWSAGELSAGELAAYSGQYRHATVAIAELSAAVAEAAPAEEREDLRRHAAEEAAHVGLWDGFVDAAGGDSAAQAEVETSDCVETWAREDGFLRGLVRLYAIESGQPAISRTKRQGLDAHYGIHDGAGNEYFRVHERMDVEHAAQARSLIERHLDGADPEELIAAAESAFRANWRLLDGVA
jgi:pyrroloquinoline-quinone synthase